MKIPVRRAAAIPSSLLFLLAFLQAPFDHIHAHEAEEHPHGGLFHTHFGEAQAPSGVELRDYDPDQDAASLDLFQPSGQAAVHIVAVLVSVAVIAPPRRQAPESEPVEARSHDPPASPQTSPRAPPA